MKDRAVVHLIISKNLFIHFNCLKLTSFSWIKNFVEGLVYDMDIFFGTTGNIIRLRFRAEPEISPPEDTQLGTVVGEMGVE